MVSAVGKCLKEHQENKKILKNAIYAIGNISFYSKNFAEEMRPIIGFLKEGLSFEDEHLLLNTLSTSNNLLRHGSVHLLHSLIDSGVFTKIL